jgi:hypothetical protein
VCGVQKNGIVFIPHFRLPVRQIGDGPSRIVKFVPPVIGNQSAACGGNPGGQRLVIDLDFMATGRGDVLAMGNGRQPKQNEQSAQGKGNSLHFRIFR